MRTVAEGDLFGPWSVLRIVGCCVAAGADEFWTDARRSVWRHATASRAGSRPVTGMQAIPDRE